MFLMTYINIKSDGCSQYCIMAYIYMKEMHIPLYYDSTKDQRLQLQLSGPQVPWLPVPQLESYSTSQLLLVILDTPTPCISRSRVQIQCNYIDSGK